MRRGHGRSPPAFAAILRAALAALSAACSSESPAGRPNPIDGGEPSPGRDGGADVAVDERAAGGRDAFDDDSIQDVGPSDVGAQPSDTRGDTPPDAKSDATPADAGPDGCASDQLTCGNTCHPADDVHACGSCSNDCAALPHVSGAGLACTMGRCSYACAPGRADCGDAGAGCATDLSASVNCGACGVACGANAPLCAPSGDASSAFACASACPPSAPTPCAGTCVDTTVHPSHCGSCGHACSTTVAHAEPVCQSSGCAFRCLAGFDVCNGACVDFQTDAANCGGCGAAHACGANEVCRNGACICPSVCGGACVDLKTSADHCGRCNHGCQGGTCAAAACQPIVLATGQAVPLTIAVDATNVYWATNTNGDGAVRRVAKNGGPTVTLASGQPSPYRIAIDAANVYWTNLYGFETVMKVPKIGGTPTVLASIGRNVQGIGVDATNVYFTDNTGLGSVNMVPIGGGAPVPLAPMEANPGPLAVTDTGAYWIKYSNGRNVAMTARPGGGAPKMLGWTVPPGGNAWAVMVDATDVYWAETYPGKIVRVPIGGGTATVVASPGYVMAIALDGANLFWGDQLSASILTMPKSGGAPVTLATGQAAPTALAVEATTIYWVNGGHVDGADGSVMKLAR